MCSWRIALLERFWQARHPPRYAAFTGRRHPVPVIAHWTPQLLVSPKFSQWRTRPPACARPGPRICLAEFTPSKAGLAPQRTGSRKSARWLAVVLLTRSGSPSQVTESKPESTLLEQGSYRRLYGAVTRRQAADMAVKCRPLFISMHNRPAEAPSVVSSPFGSLQSS